MHLLQPSFQEDMYEQLCEKMRMNDPSLKFWNHYLTFACKHLEKHGHFHSLYEIQLFIRVNIISFSQIISLSCCYLTLKVLMSGMPDMTPTSLAASVAPLTGKIIENGIFVFERGEICYKMVYYTLCI